MEIIAAIVYFVVLPKIHEDVTDEETEIIDYSCGIIFGVSLFMVIACVIFSGIRQNKLSSMLKIEA